MLKTLHGFTEKVIAERKQELEEKKAEDGQVEEVVIVDGDVDGNGDGDGDGGGDC